jgi:DNA-binding transcriptional regulator YiaG
MERNIVREIREALKLTQQEFADLLGCSKMTIRRCEGQGQEPGLPANKAVLSNLRRMAKRAGIELE